MAISQPEDMKDNITVSPNPTSGIFSVNMEAEGLRDIYIYDVTGRIVLESKGTVEKSISIDLNKEAEGVYFIRVIDTQSSVITKVVKQ
jgi:hypothetical protein